MELFRVADLPILIMINSLRSSDENEARLASKLTNIYNSSILSNKHVDIAMVHGEIVQFWAKICEARQLMSSPEEIKEAIMEIQDPMKGENKENKTGKIKGNSRKREH